MDNQAFEQVIDLKDKPSVRKNRTPEMNELYKQGLFNHLFSIEEEGTQGRALCSRKRLMISAASVIAVMSVVTVLALLTTGTFEAWKVEATTSNDRSKMNKTSDKDIDIEVQPTTTIDDVVITSLGSTAQTPYVCPNITSLDDEVQGCIPSPLSACRSINLCETFLPNRFNLAQSLTQLQERYNGYINKMNLTCHPYVLRFLCSRVSPPCPKVPIQETAEPNYAFDVINFPYVQIPMPCKSLCEKISGSCIEDKIERADFNSLCTILPESTSEGICFGDTLAKVPLCQSFTCENGGSCFTVFGQPFCKCQPGNFGAHCEINSSSDYHVVQGQCVSVPEQCRSVLPYNTTRGLNLSDSHLAYIAYWERITPLTYAIGINETRVTLLFCGLFYPQCTTNELGVINNVTIVCWSLCNRIKIQYNVILATMGFPTLICEKLPSEAPPGYVCLT